MEEVFQSENKVGIRLIQIEYNQRVFDNVVVEGDIQAQI